MLESAQTVLDNYIDTTNVFRFTFYSVEMERGENPEDVYYLCSIKDGYYVVFETDYILGTLADVAREAAEIFKGYNLAPLHWMVKKDAQNLVGAPTIPIDASNLSSVRESLVSDKGGSSYGYAVRYAVIEFTDTRRSKQGRFTPTAHYGGITS